MAQDESRHTNPVRMSLGGERITDNTPNGISAVLPHIFGFRAEEVISGLQVGHAEAAIEALKGKNGLHGVYQSIPFTLRREGFSQSDVTQFQTGFAFMTHAIAAGLAVRGGSLPYISDEVHIVARYEYVLADSRSLEAKDALQAVLCERELGLLVAVDAAMPQSTTENGAPLDRWALWEGAVGAYAVLARAAADSASRQDLAAELTRQ